MAERTVNIPEATTRFIQSITPKVWGRAARGFLVDLCCGVIQARSLVLSEGMREIARIKRESVRYAYKRVNRNLGMIDLSFCTDAARRQALDQLTPNHIVAIDPGDIAKPAAKQMEGAGPVADGSKKHQVTSGFFLLGAVAVNPMPLDKTPIPIALKTFSPEERSFVSENRLILDLVGWRALTNAASFQLSLCPIVPQHPLNPPDKRWMLLPDTSPAGAVEEFFRFCKASQWREVTPEL